MTCRLWLTERNLWSQMYSFFGRWKKHSTIPSCSGLAGDEILGQPVVPPRGMAISGGWLTVTHYRWPPG
jgi:hypothetical protein